MIAISLHFLAGRFHATPWGHHVNEGVVEWPPSPWRLLRSLVAVFHRARPADVTESQLERIVTALSRELPFFALPPATTAHTRHYDQDNGGVKFFDTFIAVGQREPVICCWQETDLAAEDRAALRSLLTALNTLGRAESWCEAALLADLPQIKFNSQPYQPGQSLAQKETMKLLLPDPMRSGIYETLITETSTMRKAKMLEPDGTRWVTYWRDADAFAIKSKRSSRIRENNVSIARFALDSTVLPLVQDALPFAEQVRR
ncbi:MAG TPA: type I-U CRISPR-associated protein Csb2, partial [Blastocatellia bacterium]|nr:type I-U CRISPR-associated protein Csb2 [Blastocatellia bacterium]